MRILLVEDDKPLAEGVIAGLRNGGLAVDWLRDAEGARAALRDWDYHLLLLDLVLPGSGGLDLLAEVRRHQDRLPVMILTARDALADRVAGLDAGADDYLTKPFDLVELRARIRALRRRAQGRRQPLLVHDDIILDSATGTVTRAGRAVDLTRREFALLEMLLEHSGTVLTHRGIEEGLYSWDDDIESNALRVHVHKLRHKLGKDLIRNVRGVGYMIERRP